MIVIIKEKLIKIYLNKAEKYMLGDHIVDAIKILDKVLMIDKNNVEALCMRGLCYSNIYDEKNSFNSFEKALEIDPSDGYIYLDWGRACINLDKCDEALKFHKILLDNFPDNLLLLQYMGSSNLFLNNIDEAFFYFNKILSQKKDSDVFVLISKCYSKLENYEKALIYLDEALKINANNTFALMEKCEIYIICENFEKALQCVNKTLKLEPDYISGIIKKNYILFKLKKYEKALNGFKIISKIKMENSILICQYYRYYGEILQDMGKYDEALDLYEEYLEKYSHFPKDDILEEKREVLMLVNK